MTKLTLEEVHTILLELGKEFDRICAKNNIPYYMLGGTMLGAVRHNGFIPWDDDMDFGIPRKYYKAFIEAAQIELSSPFRFLTFQNSEYACLGIGKLDNTTTICPEIYAVGVDDVLGVFLDVFPLDYTDGNTSLFSFNGFCRAMFKFQKLLFLDDYKRPLGKRILARLAKSLFRVNRQTIPAYLDRLLLSRETENTHVFNLYGAWGMKELVPKAYFGKPTKYEFQDTFFYGVENYDLYLKHVYGDYMQLPPEEKRHIHAIDCYYRN